MHSRSRSRPKFSHFNSGPGVSAAEAGTFSGTGARIVADWTFYAEPEPGYIPGAGAEAKIHPRSRSHHFYSYASLVCTASEL